MLSKENRVAPLRRVAIFVACFATAGSLNACKDFLTAQNPAAIPVERLEDSSLVDLMHNSVIAGLQGPNNFWYSYLSATFTDELRNNHPFIDEVLYDQRRVDVANSYTSVFTSGPIQRARWLADSVAGRMRTIYPDSALHDARLARVYAISGYQLIRLAEGWCEVPISTAEVKYSAPVPSIELFKLAEARFDSAIKIAAAARTANAAVASTTLGNRYMLASDSIRNLAYVGKARAALGRNDKISAAAMAKLVAPIGTGTNFEYRMYYNSNLALGLQNTWAERLNGGPGVTAASISNTPFLALDDARVPYPTNPTTGAPVTEATQSGGASVIPNSPLMFSTFSGTKAGADMTYDASMVLASLLEARYIIAEAEGPTATNIAFIESRRLAFPSSTAGTPTAVDNYLTNLIEQRGRDFFLDGHRIGDLRRWSKYAGISNRWPTGSYYGSATVTFGNVMCWPLNGAEITNNPNVPKPYTPPLGP
jgi:hypothetical protein